jgi:hypothetical protein
VQWIYDRFLRPIFDTIEIVRRTLQLLAALKVRWAAELDAKLAELEGRLLWPIREAYRYINETRDVVNRIIDLDGFFQRATLLRSLWRYQVEALEIWWASIHKPLDGEKKREYEKRGEVRPLDAVAGDLSAYVVRGEGPDQALIDEHAVDLARRLRLARAPQL